MVRKRRRTGEFDLAADGSTDQADSVDTALHEIAEALEGHRAWLADWHRQVICHMPPQTPDLPSNGLCQCDYGRWLQAQLQRVPNPDRETVDRLTELHAQMHQQALEIMTAVASGRPVATPAYDAFAVSFRELAEQTLELERDLHDRLVETDPLTGIRNRRGLITDLQVERERANRTNQAVCVAVIDIDRFKGINDRHGHLTGDEVLRKLTRHMLGTVRPYDRTYRLGGDEFLVCFPGTDVGTALTILERVRVGLPAISLRQEMIRFTVSAGLTDLRATDHARTALDRADAALYAAKRGGRDKVAVWQPGSMNEGRQQ